jgi:hypothetical protein
MCYERRRAEACVDHGCCLLLQYLIHSCARGGRRESVLFIGTQFSNLYTAEDSGGHVL